MQTTLTACLLATAASAQQAITDYDGTFGAIEGVGSAFTKISVQVANKEFTRTF